MAEHELNPERWLKISGILDLLLDAPADERSEILDRECAGDAELRSQVEHLLAATDSEFLEQSAQEAAANLIVDSLSEDGSAWKGKRIGPYRVKDLLGAGGMGVVYLAERDDDQFHQTVALKLIRAGVADPLALQRFNMERQILADLDHPHMARLLDGGVTDDGSPYIVMEYIEGVPITEYAEAQHLDLNARLDLFVTVCGVIEHAHRNLIVHRDLKPANILVSIDGTVKLLDFGIAKLVDPEQAGVASALTQTSSSPLTPEYSSPEQLKAEPVTTSSDVYSLGVLLYELLTGTRPYRLGGLSATERERVVCEEIPKAPSAQVSDGARRHVLSGDLDHIMLMALRKEPERRYASAHELAQEIGRYRNQKPVHATPDSAGYRLNKFVRRNKTAVVASGLIMATLLVGLGATIWQARKASLQRDLAQEESRLRQGVSDALIDILSVARPGETGVDAQAAQQVLDYAYKRTLTEFDDQPKLRASLVSHVGFGYDKLGLMARSLEVLTHAESLCVAAFGANSLEVADVKDRLANAHAHTGDYVRGAQLQRESLDIRTTLLGKDDVACAGNYDDLGYYLTRLGQRDSAHALYQRALEIRENTYGLFHQTTAVSYNNMANNLQALGRLDEAERNFREAIRIWTEVLGTHPYLAQADHNLGLLQLARGHLDSAEASVRKAIQIQQSLKLEGMDLANSYNSLGTILIESGDYESAEDVIRLALRLNVELLGEANLQVGASHLNLSRALALQNLFEDAEHHSQQGHTIFRDLFGDEHYVTAAALSYVGDVWWRSGRKIEGRQAIQAALPILTSAGQVAVHYSTRASLWLGETFMEEGDFGRAEPYLRDAMRYAQISHQDDSYKIAEIKSALGASLAHQGRYGESLVLLRDAVEQLQTSLGPHDPRTVLARARADSLSASP